MWIVALTRLGVVLYYMHMNTPYDVIAIGDIVVDAFIRIKDAEVHCRVDDSACELCLRYGDKVPFESATVIPAVGNSANASVAFARLGLKSALIASVGNDADGATCRERLTQQGVSTEYLTAHTGLTTNYHYVLWYRDDRTILVKHTSFPYALPSDLPPPKWIYLSSMGEDSLQYHDQIADYLEVHPEVKLAFQPGTFQMKIGTERLQKIYAHTEAFFCNKEEAMRILKTTDDTVELLFDGLHALGPKLVFITDGKNGAYASDGSLSFFHPIYPDPAPPLERTGAGDSYASTAVASLILGQSWQEALSWAPINSMSVVQYIGAQEGLLTREQLLDLKAGAPADYLPNML